MPNYIYTDDNYNIKLIASLGAQPAIVTSATVDVWNPAGTKSVSAAVATVSGNEITYQVAAAVLATAGVYTYEVHATFAEGQGILTYQATFVITARKT